VNQRILGRVDTDRGVGTVDSQCWACTELILDRTHQSDPCFLNPDFWLGAVSRIGHWWRKHSVDPEFGGYFTNLTENGSPPAGPDGLNKWGYVVSRTLYGLSTAFALTGDRSFLEPASSGVAFLLGPGSFRKSGFSFFQTRMDRTGRRHPSDARDINVFGQIYALTGLIAYYDTTRDTAVAGRVDESLRTLSSLYHDDEFGGFFNALSHADLEPVPGLTDGKSFNSVVDPLSATLYALSNTGLRTSQIDCSRAIRELCSLVLEYFIDPRHAFIREVFSRDWRHQLPSWRNPYSTAFGATDIGANMKTIWVLLRGLEDLPEGLRGIARCQVRDLHAGIAASGAWDAFRGGWFSEMIQACPRGATGEYFGGTDKVWWRQEEGILACLLSHLTFDEKALLDMACDGIRFWLSFFVDPDHGGIYDTVSADGIPVRRGKGRWLKGAYHETELARFLYLYLSVLRERPVVLYSHFGGEREPAEYRTTPARIPGLRWHVTSQEVVAEEVLCTRYGYSWKTAARARGWR
jgi:mannose/cellobiose epimerase-like protein (N-acyl-D-glucosamine 2-epimerase family)